jgi:hemolysin D
LRAALADGPDPLADFQPPAGASAQLVASQRQYLLTQTSESRAKLAALDRQLAQKEAERATSAATIAKIEAVIPLLQQQVDVRKTLFDNQTGSKLIYLQTLQQLVEQQQERAVQQSKYQEAEAAVAAIKETRAQAKAEFRRTLFDDLGKVEPKAAGLAQDLIKAAQRTRFQALTAPVDGVVQQLAVHTVGGVVTPAQPLLVLVPVDSHLEIEAMVPNRDVGFVEPGQEAEIKVSTFNFTRYGLLHGKVLSLSPDAVGKDDTQDPSKDKSQQAAQSAKGAGDDQGPVYAARISLDQAAPELRPGMTSNMVITLETLNNVLWVPSQALFESDGRKFVYAKGPHGFMPHDVTLVRRSESQAVITGIKEGELVAMSNPDQLNKPSNAGQQNGAMKALAK